MSIVKICKTHGDLTINECYQHINRGKRRILCKQCKKDSVNKNYSKNSERKIFTSERWRKANLERVRACKAAKLLTKSEGYIANIKAKQKAKCQRDAELLTDNYIKSILIKAFPGYKRSDFPQDLVEAKRNLLKIRRYILGVKNGD